MGVSLCRDSPYDMATDQINTQATKKKTPSGNSSSQTLSTKSKELRAASYVEYALKWYYHCGIGKKIAEQPSLVMMNSNNMQALWNKNRHMSCSAQSPSLGAATVFERGGATVYYPDFTDDITTNLLLSHEAAHIALREDTKLYLNNEDEEDMCDALAVLCYLGRFHGWSSNILKSNMVFHITYRDPIRYRKVMNCIDEIKSTLKVEPQEDERKDHHYLNPMIR
eukprot:GHVH01016431.1.p1 GENE.GHVH01016431.1~~GHVH01016431.1.p1  ORF type:complete len:224 (-),score=35.92 GHVH01016431.1:74-745(-)